MPWKYFEKRNDPVRVLHQVVTAVVVHRDLIAVIRHHPLHKWSKTNFISNSFSFLTRSFRCEHTLDTEQENRILPEELVLASHNMDEQHDSFPAGEDKEEIFPSEIPSKQSNESETTPIINEYDLPTNGQDSK